MRIVIDMQGAQGSNQQRGIGRYTLSLARAIIRNRGAHEVFLALNGLLPDTIEPIRAIFNGLLPQENIRMWYALGPVSSLGIENDWRRGTAELVREAFLKSLKPDIVLVSSLFEGLGDDTVTSIARLSSTLPTAAVLYDLIPFIQRSPYLDNPAVEVWYERKLDHLRRADLMLAISESSRQEGIRYLGLPTDLCVNISTAADPQFTPQKIDFDREKSVRLRYGLNRQFVMYTGGIDYRKNIEGLIRAYACLPNSLRTNFQLAIVCSIQPSSRSDLKNLAKAQGLKSEELVLTGFVSEDDLLTLYNLCKAFIFPSWHEGFGLPALEAMSCGRAVVGANASSLPEVIGRSDALFDPRNETSITEKLEQVLTDDDFRAELEKHGLEQAKLFSWDSTAQRAIAAFESWHVKYASHSPTNVKPAIRPKLAYVSPLPPERSGISDYSADLLPELSRHYEIDVVVAQDKLSTTWVTANCPVRTVEWFLAHSAEFDRVLYHFGNSEFHQHMFSLLAAVPGVVVLHDFFLSGILAHMECLGGMNQIWSDALYKGHGYVAIQHRFNATDTADVVWKYPCNLDVLLNARGVIVHSDNSCRLAQQWYGQSAGKDWAQIPLLRVPAFTDAKSRDLARTELGLSEVDFVVCSFGLLGPSKLNHRLLDAWLASPLAADTKCKLVFVGENADSDYGRGLLKTIARSGLATRILITGWTDTSAFCQYLASADVGVQLRTFSRGETSAAVLDCMNHGLATIVNANGSMADLPDDGLWKLSDEFSESALVAALETLWKDPRRRQQLGARARATIHSRHAPRTCADQYSQAIEAKYRLAVTELPALISALTIVEPAPISPQTWVELAQAIALSIPSKLIPRQLFVDISELVQRDSKSGIQRVVRSILQELLTNPPEGYRVEPVFATGDHGYRYARRFTLRFLNCPETALVDDAIEFRAGDHFLGLDLQPHVVPKHRAFYRKLRNHGIKVQFVVYDLLPITLPNAFPEGAAENHHTWLKVVAECDGAICISNSVADELANWMKTCGTERHLPFKISWFHLGADISASAPSKGMPENAVKVLSNLAKRPTFLIVGTLEPRKGHAQTVAAFEQLWNNGVDANLVIVGKQGWMTEMLANSILKHDELGARLFWLDGISDEYLEKVYCSTTCLIAASLGEGFGLPLIEAAQHKLPIVARDIHVFREVAGDGAFYFEGEQPGDLADALKNWLKLWADGNHQKSDNIKWLTWRESARELAASLVDLSKLRQGESSHQSCVDFD